MRASRGAVPTVLPDSDPAGTGTAIELPSGDDPLVMTVEPVLERLSLRQVQRSHAWPSDTTPFLLSDVTIFLAFLSRRSGVSRHPSRRSL